MKLRLAETFIATTLVVCATMAASAPAFADQREPLGSFRDWDAFMDTKDNGDKVCYMISSPKRTTTSKAISSRGDTFMMITHWPARKDRNVVSVIAGFTYKGQSEVRATIDGKTTFTFFTEADSAWLDTKAKDETMVAAMKRGGNVSVVGSSTRDTRLTDRYSLSGFTAAHNRISEACK